ncbi:MAG TPA: hypothetical protein VGE77_10380 [Nocardioides sp.]
MSEPHDPYRPDLTKPARPEQPGQPEPSAPSWAQGPQQPAWGATYPGGAPSQWAPQSPYGAHQSPSRDGVSLTGFFFSLTCCLGFFGMILGLIGLRRTGRGRREGRWAAVSAIVIGGLGTVATGLAIWGGVYFFNNARLVEETRVGACYDRFMDDSSSFPFLSPQDCDEPHDGEMVALTDQRDVDDAFASLGVDQEDASGAQRLEACAVLAPARYADALAGEGIRARFLADEEFPSGSDTVGCFVESADGDPLRDPLID